MMKRSQEEIAALRESFRKMDFAHKAEHIYTYYKWFILLGIAALVILGTTLHRELTKKDPILYLGLVNVSIGPDLETELTADYLNIRQQDPNEKEVQVYSGLYLSSDPAPEDHQYAYASRMKVMASVNAKMLDVVLMNKESYDLLSEVEFLLPLDGLSEAITPYLTENEVILESNAIDVSLNTAQEERIITKTVTNGMDVSSLPCFSRAGFSDTVYVGIIANTTHLPEAITYLNYLTETP